MNPQLTLLENSTDGIILLNAHLDIEFLSPSINKVLSYHEVIENLTINQLLYPEDLPVFIKQLEISMQLPELPLKGLELRFLNLDAEIVWVELSISNMLKEAEIGSLAVAVRNVSQAKKTERKLVHANRLYAFISQINQAIVRVKTEQALFDEACRIAIEYGKFEMAWIGVCDRENGVMSLVASSGTSEDELKLFKHYKYDVGGPIEKVIEGLDYYVVGELDRENRGAWNRIAVIRRYNSAMVLALKKSGQLIATFNIYSTEANFFNKHEVKLLVEANNDLCFALEVFEKERLRTLAEESREKAELRLEELNKDLREYTNELVSTNTGLQQFSYIISHNLRSPVANIMALTSYLRDETNTPETNLELHSALDTSVKLLNNVIIDLNTILTVKNEISEKRENISLTSLLKDIQLSIQTMILQSKTVITTDFLLGDQLNSLKTYLHSIFINLISNSIKYSRPGIAPVIHIKSERSVNEVIILFKDNGMGIDLEKKGDQVFGLYKRFHENIKGKGMGLFMVKTQIETLGGRISIKSEVNKGTEFTMHLPI
ncbi:GAF domain-containing sensor histidine kinase [Pedobacter sp. PWIIR3]